MTEARICRGHCYCGKMQFAFSGDPLNVAACHCDDCKRWTGAPSPAFAALPVAALQSDLGPGRKANDQVHRWNCATCGSPIAATYAYLPGQIYVPLGVLEDAGQMPPTMQCFVDMRYPWVQLDPDLPQAADSGRDVLMTQHLQGKDQS